VSAGIPSSAMLWIRRRFGPQPSEERLIDCHRRVNAMLEGGIAFWKRAVDWERGGFYGLIDYEGRPRLDADKDLVQQLRHLWSFSQIHRTHDGSAGIRAICDHQLDFVRDRLYVPARVEFYPAVASDGSPREGPVQAYQFGFGVYALANYAKAFRSTARGLEALAIASTIFRRIVEHCYDEETGFDETRYEGRWCLRCTFSKPSPSCWRPRVRTPIQLRKRSSPYCETSSASSSPKA
jgi:hypothetical protein